MNRLLVALLAAIDTLIAAAVGIAAALAPLTVFWVVGLGGGAEWSGLWPAAARIWQFGNLVPLHIVLPADYLVAAGIPAEAASFWVSLAPLGFAAFAAISAARCGARAARSGAWLVGTVTAASVTGVVAWLVWASSGNPVALVYGWQALLLPTLVFAVPALLGALVGAWRHGDDGIVDAVRARIERTGVWAGVPDAAVRGLGAAVVGFIAVGALLVAVATIARGGEVVALFEAGHLDLGGVIMVALGQFAYLPTLVVWGGAFAAGPGFALGTGSAVSPAGTNLGVLPGIPVLGIVPPTVSHWMLVSVLLLVGIGFLAGAVARSRLIAADARDDAAPRLAALGVVAVGGGAVAALLAAVASGALGPGRLADTGPAAGPVGFAVAVELLVGAAIALFAPVRRTKAPRWESGDADTVASEAGAGRAGAAGTSVTDARAVDLDLSEAAFEETAPVAPVVVLAHAETAPFVADARETREAPADAAPDDTDTEAFEASDLDPLAALGGDDPAPGDGEEEPPA